MPSQKYLQIQQNMHQLFGNWKIALLLFTVLPTFTVTVTLKKNFCCRLSLFVSVYFYRYLHTYKVSLPVNTINFLFFTGTIGITKLRCRLPSSLLYLIGVPVKQKLTFYFLQCNKARLIFDINLNEFAVS